MPKLFAVTIVLNWLWIVPVFSICVLHIQLSLKKWYYASLRVSGDLYTIKWQNRNKSRCLFTLVCVGIVWGTMKPFQFWVKSGEHNLQLSKDLDLLLCASLGALFIPIIGDSKWSIILPLVYKCKVFSVLCSYSTVLYGNTHTSYIFHSCHTHGHVSSYLWAAMFQNSVSRQSDDLWLCMKYATLFFTVLLLKEVQTSLSNISTLAHWMWETWLTHCVLIRSLADWQAGSPWVSLHHLELGFSILGI